jgi:hypothetical protein
MFLAARDAWVRVRTGLYKDDLAKVVDVDNVGLKATIRLVPRIDLNDLATKVGIGNGITRKILFGPVQHLHTCVVLSDALHYTCHQQMGWFAMDKGLC